MFRHSSNCPSDSVALFTNSFEAVTNCRDSLVRASLALVYASLQRDQTQERIRSKADEQEGGTAIAKDPLKTIAIDCNFQF